MHASASELKKVRSPLGPGTTIAVFCPNALLAALDEWRADHSGMTRSAAARQLLERGLESEGRATAIEIDDLTAQNDT
jgi:hypothetical protein